MVWYYLHPFDRKRFRKELADLCERRAEARQLRIMLQGWTPQDLDRLALADIAEEEGYGVLARAIREWMSIDRAEVVRAVRKRNKAKNQANRM
jgi:hypothetical protein